MSGVDRDHPGFVAAADQFVASIVDKVAEHGVEIIAVFADDEDGLPFAYTIGLTASGCDELVLVGAPVELAHGILNDLARRVLNGDRDGYVAGERLVDPFGTGFDVALLADDDLEDYPPNLARRIYGPEAGFLQVVWPDREHRWPWEDGFDVGQGDDGYPLLGPLPDWAVTS